MRGDPQGKTGERSVPFVQVVRAMRGNDGNALQRAVERLRHAEAGHGLRILDEEGAASAEGVFVPRDGQPLPEARLREVTRSWEAFDRSFVREPEGAAQDRLRRQLWPFLDDTHLLIGGADFAPDHLVAFDDGAVGCWTPSTWAALLARWARARRWGGRDDWHPDHFTGSLEGIVLDYAAWRDAVRAVIARARHPS